VQKRIEIVECPRDAMQGIHNFIPTQVKVDYINGLLKCGFHTVDFGSFVSPKAIPQLRDTAEVLSRLELNEKTKLLAIIANERGANDALHFEEIDYLGYPFSISEEFQKRNTNTTIEGSLTKLEYIQNLILSKNKKLVVYLSMAFGNPYGENWSEELVHKWSERLISDFGIEVLSISDTIGCATDNSIKKVFTSLAKYFPTMSIFGAHLHALPNNAKSLIHAAIQAGCMRFDSAIKGYGGCPMAKDDLTGNIPTEQLIGYCNANGIKHDIDKSRFDFSFTTSKHVFL
jgi:hydroxymethylglutaryl-CoA lyase